MAMLFLGGVAFILSSQDTPVSSTVVGTEGDVSKTPADAANKDITAMPADEISMGDAPQNGFAKLAANAIYVPEQQLGNTVIITNVNIVPEGYVVVYTTENGKADQILGFADLAEGAQLKNVEVKLSRDMKDGEELIAQLHADNGDDTFDVMTDSPVTDFADNALSMTFYAMVDASDPADVEVMF